MAAKAISQEEINTALKLTLGKLVQETEVMQEDVETSEEKEAVDGDSSEKTEEAEPKGIKASKIEDVVEEEIPAASEENTESEGKDKVPKEENEKEGGEKPQIAGVTLINEYTAKIAMGKDGSTLFVTAVMSKAKNQRFYVVWERDSEGNKLGELNYENKFAASKFEKKSTDVSDFIKNMSGIYSGQLGDIQLKLMKIEKDRLLKHSPVLDVDNSTSIEELIDKLKSWILSNIYDNRLAVFNMKNIVHIAFVRRNEKSLLQVFKDVIREVDERVDVNVVKGKLYTEDLLYHDYNPKCRDTQLTISSSVREQIGARGDKVISIKFEEEFIERVLAKRLNDQFDFIANFDDELEDYFGEEVM